MRGVSALFLMLFLASCTKKAHIIRSQSDSTRIEIRTRTEYVRDTIIREIPAISEAITTRDTASHLENFYAQSDARINTDGSLFHSLATKPQREPIAIDRPVEYRDSIVFRDRTVKDIVQVERELTWWQRTQIRGFWVLVVVVVFICRREITSLIRKFI